MDLDRNPKSYQVIIHAVDNGLPLHETATSTVFITIEDVNNKPPTFNNTNTIAYVSEKAPIDTPVIMVKAYDPDETSNLHYTINEPIRAQDKTGVAIKSNDNFKHSFKINDTGDILVNGTLNYNKAAVIILTVCAKDLNAEVGTQVACTEVTIYIQPYSDNNPNWVKLNGFDVATQTVRLKILEEQPIGFKVLNLEAMDPVTGIPIQQFDIVHSGTDLFTILQNGEIILTKRLDYEQLDAKTLHLVVKATSIDQQRSSNLKIFIEVLDINDNPPVFDKEIYQISVRESSRYPEKLLQVHAEDVDSKEGVGFGDVRYFLSGENSKYFLVDNMTGMIQLSPNLTLDRERQAVLRFNVVAIDTPKGRPGDALKTTVPVIVDVLDVNDNAPLFVMKSYLGVVAENVLVGTGVFNFTATDPDEGLGGEITYELLNEHEVNGKFR